MKKFLIAGSSLAAVGAAGAAGAVDVTLGGSIDMGVEFGVGKTQNDLQVGEAYNSISLSIAAAGTTDGGMKYGGSFTLATAGEIELNAYDTNGTKADGDKALIKMTVAGATDIEAAAYNVSGGQAINASEIVGVKINSEWKSMGATETGYELGNLDAIGAAEICKVAGQATNTAPVTLKRMTAKGDATASSLKFDTDPVNSDGSGNTESGDTVASLGGGYLPAGKLSAGISGPAVALTVDVSFAAVSTGDGFKFSNDFITGAADAKGTLGTVGAADVYAGPFMEVKLQSSSTKMVIGAVCVEGVDKSETNYFLNNASKIVTASDASIYIEGGFGKLTLQTGDYSGAVSAIGSAGNEADIGADGLVAIVEGVGLLGANPYVAVDLAPGRALNGNLEILTGGTIDMGGLSAAVDIELGSDEATQGTTETHGLTNISAWDLGLNYAMGDMNVAFAYDSGNDWGLSASMAVAGFAVDATFASDTAADHEKSGITYSVGASTSLNGFGLSLGVDQDMKPTVGLSKSMGGLSLYAGYDAADNGGKVGATLFF